MSVVLSELWKILQVETKVAREKVIEIHPVETMKLFQVSWQFISYRGILVWMDWLSLPSTKSIFTLLHLQNFKRGQTKSCWL